MRGHPGLVVTVVVVASQVREAEASFGSVSGDGDPFIETPPRALSEFTRALKKRDVEDFEYEAPLIVDANVCIVLDCEDGESFLGFLSLILKENNNNILWLNDTRTSWEIKFNDRNSREDDYIGLRNRDSGSTIFRIEATAATYVFRVTADSKVRLGSDNDVGSDPETSLHVFDDEDAPTIRLEYATRHATDIIASKEALSFAGSNDTSSTETIFELRAKDETLNVAPGLAFSLSDDTHSYGLVPSSNDVMHLKVTPTASPEDALTPSKSTRPACRRAPTPASPFATRRAHRSGGGRGRTRPCGLVAGGRPSGTNLPRTVSRLRQTRGWS